MEGGQRLEQVDRRQVRDAGQPRQDAAVHIDNSVLEGVRVEERAEIEREAAESAAKANVAV